MSTFLLSLGVVAVAIAIVVKVAMNGPDQPAMPQPRSARAQPPVARSRRRTSRRRAAARPGSGPAAIAGPGPRAADPAAGYSADRPPADAPSAGPSATATLTLPDSDAMRLRVLPAAPTTVWVRIRSFVALVVLVAVLGALLALAIGGILVGAVLVVRSATA